MLQLRLFTAPLVREAAEKIGQLFRECSSDLQQQVHDSCSAVTSPPSAVCLGGSLCGLKVSQGAAEAAELKRKLEVVEMELKLVLEGNGGRGEAAERAERRSTPNGGGIGEGVQRSGRKSRRGEEPLQTDMRPAGPDHSLYDFHQTFLCYIYFIQW